MKFFIHTLFVVLVTSTSPVFAQELDTRILRLRDRILDRVPDIPAASRGLGRGDARSHYATQHAAAIVAAADTYAEQWDSFAEEGNWEHFDARQDLPALLAAIAYRESAFQPVIRLDNNERVYSVRDMVGSIPASVARGEGPSRRPRSTRGDMGFMQVRVPGAHARACGATRRNMAQLLEDHIFSYRVGACILTRSLTSRIESYANPANRRMRFGQRPNYILRFFNEHPDLKGLSVIERYNWGNSDLYQHRTGAGYAQRVLREFLFFRTRGPRIST